MQTPVFITQYTYTGVQLTSVDCSDGSRYAIQYDSQSRLRRFNRLCTEGSGCAPYGFDLQYTDTRYHCFRLVIIIDNSGIVLSSLNNNIQVLLDENYQIGRMID